MAERRMFAKTIVLSDAFLDMPMTTRNLYFTLGMVADDDGFVNNPRSIMRQIGASDDDMKMLLAKKFVLVFDSGVIVIKHWRINNYLQKDRYKDTKYLEERDKLQLDKNGAYQMKSKESMYTQEMYTDSVYTQDRLVKDRVGEESKGKYSKEQDNNSLSKIEEIGESEGEEQTPPAAGLPSGDAREKRIQELRDSAQRFVRLGFAPDSIYELARAEGIDPQEIIPIKAGAGA